MYDDGCAQGQRDAALGVGSGVFLDFGGEVDGGTQLIGGQFKSRATIASFVQSFAKGYYVCTGSDTSTVLHIAVGTNNSLHTSSADGDSWANEMSIIESDISGYASQVVIYGASDMSRAGRPRRPPSPGFRGMRITLAGRHSGTSGQPRSVRPRAPVDATTDGHKPTFTSCRGTARGGRSRRSTPPHWRRSGRISPIREATCRSRGR